MPKNIDEKKLAEEVMAEAYKRANTTYSVEEALLENQEYVDELNKCFAKLWRSYDIASQSRSDTRKVFIDAKVRTYIYSIYMAFFSFLYRGNAYEEVVSSGNDISKSLRDLREEKKLLELIRTAITELEKINATECNNDIAELLKLIYDKNSLMFKLLNEDRHSLKVRMSGIDYVSNTGNRQLLELVNEEIDTKVQSLQLKPKYDK